MTVLPFIDIKATPIRTVESPRRSIRTQSLQRAADTDDQSAISDLSSKVSSVRSSIPAPRARTPRIKISRRTDDSLKDLPWKKSARAENYNYIWKPLTRELPDYDYVWDPVQREDIRHQYDSYTAPNRIRASRPDDPYKMTTMFETEDRHYHNYRRVRAMQQRQWNREHIQYTIYPYAQTEERERYNKHIRSTLKRQMEAKDQEEKLQQELTAIETRMIIEKDQQDQDELKQRHLERARALLGATARNKELMENKWEFDQWNRFHQWHVDRVMLADDPINWSKTLT